MVCTCVFRRLGAVVPALAAVLAMGLVPAAHAEVLFTNHAALGTAIIRQADGSFLIGGDAEAGARFALMKLRPSGRPDMRFGSGGFSQVSVGRSDFDDLTGVLALRDGRILVTGTVGTDNSVQNGSGTMYGVARFTSRGRLDRSFGHGSGWVRFTPYPTAPGDKSEWIAQTPDGRVMIGGDSQTDPSGALFGCAFSFDVNLTATPGFHPPCERLGNTDTQFADAAPAGGGATVLGVYAQGSDPAVDTILGITRITASGAVDPGFGSSDGASTIDFGPQANSVNQTGVTRLRARAGGGWVVAGAAPHGFGFAGFTAQGTPDPAFGANGRVVVDADGTSSRDVLVDMVSLDRGRKFLAVGQTELARRGGMVELELVRLNANGSLDRSFGRGGRLVLTPNQLGVTNIAQVDAAVGAGHGSVVIVGATHEDRYGVLVVKLNSRGRVVRSFGA